MTTVLLSGVLLGLSAGLSPGPMLALVLAQTLRYGSREGCKVALTPLVTDPPIIALTLAFATQLAQFRPLLGVVSMVGAMFVLYLAWESLWPVRQAPNSAGQSSRSWLKGIVTNLLNPHPWLFWLTVGAAFLARAIDRSWLHAGAFLLGFYLLLVGSKVTVALLAGRSRHLLAGRGYRVTMRALAIMLALLAVLLFREGLRQLARIS
jgi:threonine/homoserine/homoserine lactone efflux protein